MSKVHGGWLVAKTLHELGVSEIFSLSGGHINPIYDACIDLNIRIIDTHHEQGAAMAADAYGRVKRKPGICLVTAGPGLSNAVTGMAGAYLSNAPCVVLSGRAGIEENDRIPLQDIDQQSMVAPVTKWAQTVYDIKRIPDYVATAYRKAITGRPGPVYLGMPYEILYGSCSEEEAESYSTELPYYKTPADEGGVKEALEMLRSSERPVVIAGSGAWYSGAVNQLKNFIEKANIPLFTLNFGRGIVPDDDPLCFGAASPSAPNAFRKITSESDLILLLGVRLSLYIGWGRTFNADAKIIQVDIDPGEIGRNRPADIGITGDISRVLSQFTSQIRQESIDLDFSKWTQQADSWRREEWNKVEEIKISDNTPIHPLRVIRAVEEIMDRDDMLVIDGGDTQVWTDTNFPVREPGHYVKGGPLGCMGVGVPFAIGTKVACPDRQVVLISGDGAMGMNFMEFETAVRHNIPFVSVVCNDRSWGMTKRQMLLTYGKDHPTVGMDLPLIPFDELVRTIGGYGELVTDPAELSGALGRAISSGVPALINVTTDPEAISPATISITQLMLPKDERQ